MLAPAVLWLLASLTSSPARCLAFPQLPNIPPLQSHESFDIDAYWAKLKAEFTPPLPPIPEAYGPQPEPRRPHRTRRDEEDSSSDVGEGPSHPMKLTRLYRPWGDGFVRLPIQREKLNNTDSRRQRGYGGVRWRRPNRSYPPYNAGMGPMGPGMGPPPMSPNATASAPPKPAAGRRSTKDSPIPARDVAVGSPAASPAAAPAPAAADAQAADPWGWSDITGLPGGFAYIITIGIGTPIQQLWVMVDTGSYELWVNPNCMTSVQDQLCQVTGHYYPQQSTTSSTANGSFFNPYGTGYAKGSYYVDMFYVSTFGIPSVHFAVANESSYAYAGVMGLGYPSTKYPYPSLLSVMWSLGYIAAPVFSLGLGGESQRSEIVFGGVNRWKYSGPLTPVDVWPPFRSQDPEWPQYWVNMTSFGITPPGQNRAKKTFTNDAYNTVLLIDTSSTLSYMEEDIVKQIGREMNATRRVDGVYTVDCAMRDANGTVNFGFKRGQAVIAVKYRDFIWRVDKDNCWLGVQPVEPGKTEYVLGDTFLRGAYLVFDQQSDVVWMANYYNCGDGVSMVGEKKGATANMIGAC